MQHPNDGDIWDLMEQIKLAKEGLEKGGKGRKLKVEDDVSMVAEGGASYETPTSGIKNISYGKTNVN